MHSSRREQSVLSGFPHQAPKSFSFLSYTLRFLTLWDIPHSTLRASCHTPPMRSSGSCPHPNSLWHNHPSPPSAHSNISSVTPSSLQSGRLSQLPGPLLCFCIDPHGSLSLQQSSLFPEGIVIYFPKETSFTL